MLDVHDPFVAGGLAREIDSLLRVESRQIEPVDVDEKLAELMMQPGEFERLGRCGQFPVRAVDIEIIERSNGDFYGRIARIN